MAEAEFTFHPVTSERWQDFETLFGKNGACAGCWCMWWRESRSEFSRMGGKGNRQGMRQIIESGQVPGILAYDRDLPAGWCSIAPRVQFPSLDRSWVLKRVDEKPVWSIVCFFIARPYRRRGMTSVLIGAALNYAHQNGAQIIEAYPVDKPASFSALQDFTGVATTFQRAGFVEVARRSPTRPLMRYEYKD